MLDDLDLFVAIHDYDGKQRVLRAEKYTEEYTGPQAYSGVVRTIRWHRNLLVQRHDEKSIWSRAGVRSGDARRQDLPRHP